MQTYNSFNELATAQTEAGLFKATIFNAGALTDSLKEWWQQQGLRCAVEPKDITFADALRMLLNGDCVYSFFEPYKGILDRETLKHIIAEVADRIDTDYDVLYATWSNAKERKGE